MRSLEQAQRDVLAAVTPLSVLELPVWDALGLGLASPVVAPHDVPPFTNSAMDGYAVQGADVEEAPVTLRLLEDVPAGHVAQQAVHPGAAIKIMTGAPIPEGADTVVKVEDTTPLPDGVRIVAATAAGTAVRPAGGDLAAGEPVFAAGERLTPPHLAVLASLGVSPRVHRRPRVAMLSTGDEVLPPETGNLGPGQIRDTNRPLLAAMLDELGVEVVDLGIVGDDADVLRDTLERGAGEADMVLTSGGVSMGEYDLVKIIPPGARHHRLLEGGDAARQTLRLRPHRGNAAPGPARQSGVGDGGVRAVRPPRPVADDGLPGCVPGPGRGPGRRGLADRSGQDGLRQGGHRGRGRIDAGAEQWRAVVQRSLRARPGRCLCGDSRGHRTGAGR